MYGLINSALRDMITERFGDEKWSEVMQASGVSEDSFLTMRSYDDQVTYALAGAASEVLEAPLDTCLEMFGEYWVLETATKSYGVLMDTAGTNMTDFLGNLNALHDRITSTFLNYLPPTFKIEHVHDEHYEIHYISQRQGLEAFVVGLLKGLGTRFDCRVTFLSREDLATDTGTHTVFTVTIVA